VVAVLEAARARPRLADLPALLLEPGILARGVGYQLRLRRRGLAVRRAMTIIAARGRERVEHAVIAPIAEDGAIDRARAETLAVDTVIAGFGLQPASELTRNIGCRHCYDAAKGGWIPERSDELETSIANVFAVGECAGAGGMEKAALEGALAGTIAATRLGAKAGTLALKRRLARLMRFRAAIERIYAPPASWLAMLTPETIVCRCEEVTAATLQAEIADGLTHVDSLKACTRASMGRCQGRNCLATVAAMIAAAEGRMPADIALPRARAPVKPVPVGVVAAPELLGTGDG
jgi:NAD(P)H-nitrite reductase large subunit